MTVPSVADNELIQTAWGNTVAADVNNLLTRTTNVETYNGAQDTRMNAIDQNNNQQQYEINTERGRTNHLYARTDWFRARVQGTSIGSNVWVAADANGAFNCNFPGPFPPGTPTAVVATVADSNIGAWIVVYFSNNVGFTGRFYSSGGAVPGLGSMITYVAWAFQNDGYP